MPDGILIVEDEQDVADLLGFTLKKEGFQVVHLTRGEEALKKISSLKPSLVVLDLMLPGMSGVDVCRAMKGNPEVSDIPIIMLTAKTEETDRIVGLELGAEDYIVKPFSPREVILRIRGVLRRIKGGTKKKSSDTLKGGPILVNIDRYEVTVKGKSVRLTSTEFKLLTLLMERRGRVQTRDRLLEDVWNYETSIDTRTVDTHMRRLREKLGSAGENMIETIRGVGYRFVDE